MIVIWIDPGTTTVWYAISKINSHKKELIDYWVIQTIPKSSFEDKILEISKDIDFLIKKYKPQKVVIEKLFFSRNITNWIDVAWARGVIIYKFKKAWVLIEEYTPLQLKSAICWNWKASKIQLQNAIKIFFNLKEIPKPDDAADAIWLSYMWLLNNKNIKQ